MDAEPSIRKANRFNHDCDYDYEYEYEYEVWKKVLHIVAI
jgi:hypothetical protein